MYTAWITRVVDGDTLEAWVQLREDLRELVRLRLDGVDAPEVKGQDKELGKMSAEWVRRELADCPSVIVVRYRGDSFGRWISDVIYDKDGGARVLSTTLKESGHAVEYTRSATDDSLIMDVPW